ncbi:MAG: PqqD family protein [Planctomycetota bacterium]|nr:PqqD family protein [Planctomycetota bacterium]
MCPAKGGPHVETRISANMDINTRFMPIGEVIFRRIGDEAILVPRRDGVADLCNYIVLENEVTTTMWKLANGGMSVAEIASKVAEEYDVTVEAAVADATEFCESLVRAKLLGMRQV